MFSVRHLQSQTVSGLVVVEGIVPGMVVVGVVDVVVMGSGVDDSVCGSSSVKWSSI